MSDSTKTITYTDPKLTTDVRITVAPRNPYADGYGPKVPTSFMIRFGGRWRRVYCMFYGNSGSPYVVYSEN